MLFIGGPLTWKRSQDSSRFDEVKYKHSPFHRLSKRTMGFDSTLGFAGEGPLAFGLGLLCVSNLMYGSVDEFVPVCSVSAGLWVLLGLALAPCLWLLCVSLSSHPTASALCQSAHSVLSVLVFCHPTNRSHSRPPELGSFCGFSVGRYYGVGAINALVIALSWGGIATIGDVGGTSDFALLEVGEPKTRFTAARQRDMRQPGWTNRSSWP